MTSRLSVASTAAGSESPSTSNDAAGAAANMDNTTAELNTNSNWTKV